MGGRTSVKNDEGTSGEAESLARHKKRTFGDLAVKEKAPSNEAQEKIKKKAAEAKASSTVIDPSKASRLPVGTQMAGHVLGMPIVESQLYNPKTKETRSLYEELLNIVQNHMGDESQEVLKGAADEVLAILKNEKQKDSEKKTSIEIITGSKISDETLNKLVLMSKQFVDFTIESKKQNVDDDANRMIDVAVNIDEKEASEVSDEVQDEEKEKEEVMNEGEGIKKITTGEEKMEEGEEGQVVDPSLLDGFWLQRELAKYFPEQQIIDLEKSILSALSESNTARCQNQLIEILNYEKNELIKKLLKDQYKIYYVTCYARAETLEEKNKVLEEMKSKSELNRVALYIEKLRDKRDKDKEHEKNVVRQAKNISKKEKLLAEDPDILLKKLSTEGEHVKALEESNEPRQKLDLSSLIFSQGSHIMTNKQCKLPKETYRVSKKGYEEILVPAEQQIAKEDEKLIKISSLPEWAQDAFIPVVDTLNRIQSKIYPQVFKTNENLLVCAPTGAGKTNIALLAIMHQVGLHRSSDGEINLDAFKIVYIAPMKALVAEIVGNFKQRLSKYGMKVRELTGDAHLTKAQIDETQVIVATPEKWDVITRKSSERSFINKVKLIIIDEIHLLHDLRGPVLETIVARTIRQIEATQETVRIVALSATLPNYKDVAAFLRVKMDGGVFFFDSTYRPVPLEQVYIGITEKKAIKRHLLMNEILYEKVMERAGKHQILVFVHSRKETARTAKIVRDMALAKEDLGKFLKEVSKSREILQEQSEKVMNHDLKDLLPFGIGIHHAGLTKDDRTIVESLFGDKHLQLLVSTSTLAWGVNLPAHTVIIKGTQVYSPEMGRWMELSPQDILQMMGRAGRPHYDKTGEGIVITSHSELQYYLSLNNMQLPIESQFLTQLPDHLNAEIVLRTISNTREAVAWLGYTYLFIRMLMAPEQYGITPEMLKKDKYLVQYRADLIHTAADILDKANLIKYDRKTGLFQVTAIGRVASHYYIKYDSMAIYNENLKSNMNMIELFRVFGMSKEFQYITIREEEKLELEKFSQMVPVPINASMDEPLAKIIILLQGYISRFKLEGYALNADMIYVSQSAGRIMRCIFEIALKRGWAILADTSLKCFKMVDRRMWSVSTPLRQFPGLPEELLRKLEKKEQFTWEQYYQMTPQEVFFSLIIYFIYYIDW